MPRFTDLQRAAIVDTATMVMTRVEETGVEPDAMFTAGGAASIILETGEYGTLSPEWEPDATQIEWIHFVMETGMNVYREHMELPDATEGTRAVLFDEISMMASIRRDCMALV